VSLIHIATLSTIAANVERTEIPRFTAGIRFSFTIVHSAARTLATESASFTMAGHCCRSIPKTSWTRNGIRSSARNRHNRSIHLPSSTNTWLRRNGSTSFFHHSSNESRMAFRSAANVLAIHADMPSRAEENVSVTATASRNPGIKAWCTTSHSAPNTPPTRSTIVATVGHASTMNANMSSLR